MKTGRSSGCLLTLLVVSILAPCGVCGEKAIRVAIYHADQANATLTDRQKNEIKSLPGKGNPSGISIGETGIMEVLQQAEGIEATYVGDVSLPTLTQHDVLIVPHAWVRTFDKTPEGKAFRRRLHTDAKGFVLAGGGVLLIGHQTGHAWGHTIIDCPFPEVAYGKTCNKQGFEMKGTTYQAAGDHDISRGVEGFFIEYYHGMEDAVVQRPGPLGQVFLADTDGYVEGVAGEYGAGRVACLGAVLGIEVTKTKGEDGKEQTNWVEAAPTDGRKRLLLNLVRWLGVERQPDFPSARAALHQLSLSAAAETIRWERRFWRLSGDDSRVHRAWEVQQAVVRVIGVMNGREGTLRELVGKVDAVKPDTLATLATSLAAHPLDSRTQFRDAVIALDRAIIGARNARGLKPVRKLPRFLRGFSVQYFDLHANMDDMTAMFEDLDRAHANMISVHYHWVKDYPRHSVLADVYGMGINVMTNITSQDTVAELMGKFMPHSAFAAYHVDEPGMWPKSCFRAADGSLNQEGVEAFRKYVAEHVDPKEVAGQDLEKFIRDTVDARRPSYRLMMERAVLWHLLGRYMQEQVYRKVDACRQKAKEMEADAPFKVLLSPVLLTMPYMMGSPTSLGPMPDVLATDIYSSGGYGDRLILEMMRGCSRGTAKRVVLWNGWRNRSPHTYRRSCVAGIMHSDGVMSFTFAPVYWKRNAYGDGWKFWCPGGYEVAQELFGLIERAEDFLSPTRSMAATALLVSERTMWNHYYYGWGSNARNMYYAQLSSIYTQLLRSHLLVDVVWADLLKPGGLDQYKVIVAPEAASISDAEAAVLSDWVKRGGMLVVTARTSGLDAYGRPRGDYALGHAFGVTLKKPFVAGYRVRLKEYLALKARSLSRAEDHALVRFLPEKEPMAYEGERFGGVYEHDVVEARQGTSVLARLDDGTPAITLSRFGKGGCVFTSAQWLGLCPGADGFWSAAVRWGLKQAGSQPAALLDSAEPEIEVNLRQTADGSGIALHLCNLGEAYTIDKTKVDPETTFHVMTRNLTSGVVARVRLPEGWRGKKLAVRDPVAGKDLAHEVDGERIVIKVPDFAMYQLITVSADAP